MIQVQTMLHVIDNSGAQLVRCIKVLGKSRTASAGDVIVVAVQQATKKISAAKVEKGQVHRAVVVATRKHIRRKNGSTIRFDKNTVILLKDAETLLGTRVFGPIAQVELSRKPFLKILLLSPYCI